MHSNTIRLYPILLVLCSITWHGIPTCQADESCQICFPWSSNSSEPPAAVGPTTLPYQTLAIRSKDAVQAVPYQAMQHDGGYAYGWFGSNPHPRWYRQFGYRKSFTQWSLE